MTSNIKLNQLTAKLQGYYQDILRVTQPLLTNRDKTGILDNTQRAEQDQEQSGQLSFIIVGILRLTNQLDDLRNNIESIEQDIKTLRNRPTISGGTSTSGLQAQIGQDFLTYNPPEK